MPSQGSFLRSQKKDRAANSSAARQVTPSLVKHASLPGGQKPDGFVYCLGVLIAPKNLANSVGVGSESVNDIRIGNALQAHHMGCNSLSERECASLECDDVHFDTCDRVSFVWGSFPKQISHGLTSLVAGGTALGRSGILPAVRWYRALLKGAVSSAGVATANRRPGIHNSEYVTAAGQPSLWGESRKYLWMKCGNVPHIVAFAGEFSGFHCGVGNCFVSTPQSGVPKISEFASCWRQLAALFADLILYGNAAGAGAWQRPWTRLPGAGVPASSPQIPPCWSRARSGYLAVRPFFRGGD